MNDTNDFDPASGAPTPKATADKNSGLAIASLVLGMLGLCITPLGIVALFQIADPQRQLTGKGSAVAGMILGGLSIVVLIAIILPVLSAARNSARNSVDLSNLREIAHAMHSYAAGNGDVLPDHPRDVMTHLVKFVVHPQDAFISRHHDPNTVLERGDSDGTAVRYGSYVFLLPGVSLDDIDSPSYTVLAYTARASDSQRQRAVLFVGGHCELMEEQDFRALIPPEVDVDALDGP